METRYTVVVRNDSELPLENVRVFGGGCDLDFGTLSIGAQATRRLRIERDGELRFHATSGETQLDEVIDGYVTRSLGGQRLVTVGRDRTVALVGGPSDD